MEGKRFDDLTRLVGKGASRRAILKGLLGLGGAAVAGAEADARTLRTRPTIPPPPPPPPTTTSTTPAPLCGPTEEQCPFSTVCCPSGTCARSGNQAFCCDGTNGAGNTPCGLDCCDDPYQCCDRECCGDDAVCLVRVFGAEGPGIEEEVCCPADQACDGQCCDGTCYVSEGFFLAFNGFPFDPILAERSCCPGGNSVCYGFENAVCCDDATEECCTDASGVATCIPIGGCCTDEACEDICQICDLETGTCVNRCADDPDGPYCCPSESTSGYVCFQFDECCPGDDCGGCGTCQDGTCEALPGNACLECQTCALQEGSNLYECVADPAQAGELCEQCKVCDDSGGCTINAEDNFSCSFYINGVCCSGVCTDPQIGCPTTTTTSEPATTTSTSTTPDPAATTTTAPPTSTTPSPCDPPCGPGFDCCVFGTEPPTCIPAEQCCTAADCPPGDPRLCEVAVCRERECGFDSECNFENERCCPDEQGIFACTTGFTCPELTCSSVDDCEEYGLDLDCVVCSGNVCRANEGSCDSNPCRPCAEPGICGIEVDEAPCGDESVCCGGECVLGDSCDPVITTTEPPVTTAPPTSTTEPPVSTTGQPPECVNDDQCDPCEVCNLGTGTCQSCFAAGLVCCVDTCQECCTSAQCIGECMECSAAGTCEPTGSCNAEACRPGSCNPDGSCTYGAFDCALNQAICCPGCLNCTGTGECAPTGFCPDSACARGVCNADGTCGTGAYDCSFNPGACCDDGNECTQNVCSGNECSHPNVADFTFCDNGGRWCVNGVCSPI